MCCIRYAFVTKPWRRRRTNVAYVAKQSQCNSAVLAVLLCMLFNSTSIEGHPYTSFIPFHELHVCMVTAATFRFLTRPNLHVVNSSCSDVLSSRLASAGASCRLFAKHGSPSLVRLNTHYLSDIMRIWYCSTPRTSKRNIISGGVSSCCDSRANSGSKISFKRAVRIYVSTW